MRDCIISEVYFQHESMSDDFRNEPLVLRRISFGQRNTEVRARGETGNKPRQSFAVPALEKLVGVMDVAFLGRFFMMNKVVGITNFSCRYVNTHMQFSHL